LLREIWGKPQQNKFGNNNVIKPSKTTLKKYSKPDINKKHTKKQIQN
jgi:hypothetical protein